MDEFEIRFRDNMRSSVPLLDTITHYIVKRKGKQMRPMFVFLSAKLCGGFNDCSYRAATHIELLHTATLVHDDVVDDSNLRRGFFSINALWKNKIAVLVGDYLLSKGLLLSVGNNDYRLLQITSNSVREMSEGELLQIEKARKLDITEEVYFEIIRKKTATLIASCCACGAASVTEDIKLIENMRQFGELAGMAFQIKDDLFDYENHNKTGKPTGIDIKEKKMTLPLIHALKMSNAKEKREIINVVKNHNTDNAKVKQVIETVIAKGGISYSTEKMNQLKNQALSLLETFPSGPIKEALAGLVEYTIGREL